MFEIRAYKLGDRVVVQYYDSGNKDTVVCPDCHCAQDTGKVCSDEGHSSGEFSCPQCGTNLGMVSSLLPPTMEEPTMFF